MSGEVQDLDSVQNSARERARVYRNTYLQSPRWLFDLVIKDEKFDRVLCGDERLQPYWRARSNHSWKAQARRIRDRIVRAIWFWPRINEAYLWSVADAASNWAPEKYLRDEPRRLLKAVMDSAPKDYRILDLGCNCGSDLNILAVSGWKRLSGVDAGAAALALFREKYPDTFSLASIKHDLFQRFLAQTDSASFDLTYSNGATIELVHPSFPIIHEICRVTAHTVLVDISERGGLYPRDYEGQFKRAGFLLVSSDRPSDRRSDLSLLRFDRVIEGSLDS